MAAVLPWKMPKIQIVVLCNQVVLFNLFSTVQLSPSISMVFQLETFVYRSSSVVAGIFPGRTPSELPPSMALEEGLGSAHALLGQRWVIQLVPEGHTSAMIRDPRRLELITSQNFIREPKSSRAVDIYIYISTSQMSWRKRTEPDMLPIGPACLTSWRFNAFAAVKEISGGFRFKKKNATASGGPTCRTRAFRI